MVRGMAEEAVAKPRKVSRGLFTTKIVDREPSDRVLVLTNDTEAIFFFTDLRHFEGQTITHRWEYEGNPVSEKQFKVGGPRWRVYSKKTLNPKMTGEWTVVVTDGRGWPVYAEKFEYVKKEDGKNKSIILPLE